MDLLAFSGQFWTANNMPDTKSGIKHLSNMASMHQNIFVALQNVFNKQFKNNMKVYSKEMNVIKDDLTRLLREKDKYEKQRESRKKLKTASTDELSSNAEELLEELTKQEEHSSHELAKKVENFTKSSNYRRFSGSTIQEEEEEDEELEEEEGGRSFINDDVKNGHYSKRIRREKSAQSRLGGAMEDLDELEEDEYLKYQSERLSPSHESKHRQVPGTAVYKPTFQNDRFVNSTVNDARAKLTALYRQSILGPNNGRKQLSVVLPLAAGSKHTPGATTTRRRNVRSHSALASYAETSRGSKPTHRKAKSANPAVNRRPRDDQMQTEPLKAAKSSRPSSSAAVVSFKTEEDESSHRPSKRERHFLDVQEGVQSRYKTFEQALHRRMMIREMKAAEYDANHTVRSSITLQEVLPTKSSAMSDVLRRQSAIIALERSILGGANH